MYNDFDLTLLSDNDGNEKLTELINDQKMSFNHFLQIIRYFYQNSRKILHLKTKTNERLLQTALRVYGKDMQQILSMWSVEDETVLGVFISFDNPDNLQLLTSIGIPDKEGQSKELMYQAIKYDALETLKQLYHENEEIKSIDGLAVHIVKNEINALFFAAEFNAKNCFDWIVSNTSREILSILVHRQFEKPEKDIRINVQIYNQKDSILHCLARNDALDSFKLLVQKINSKKDVLHLLHEVKGKAIKSNIPYFQKYSVFESAFFANNLQVFDYIAKELACANPIDLLKSDIFNFLIIVNNPERIKYLHGLCNSEQQWFEFVEKNIFTVFKPESYPIILYILESVKKNQNLIQLLSKNTGSFSDKPIDRMQFKKFNRVEMTSFINTILSIFEGNPDQLEHITRPYVFLIMTLKTNDINLVRTVLKYYYQSQKQFERICNETHTRENLLGCVLSGYDNEDFFRKSTDWNIIQLFTESLLGLCTVKQQNILLTRMHWDTISGKTASYVVKKLKALPEKDNTKNWLYFSSADILFRSFQNKKGPEASIYLLEYYKEIYNKNDFLEIVQICLKECADEILSDRLKAVLINCTPEQRAKLLDAYKNNMILKNLKDTKALDDYVSLLDILDSTSRLHTRKRSSNTFFSGVASDMEPLYYFDESYKLVLRTMTETGPTLTIGTI